MSLKLCVESIGKLGSAPALLRKTVCADAMRAGGGGVCVAACAAARMWGSRAAYAHWLRVRAKATTMEMLQAVRLYVLFITLSFGSGGKNLCLPAWEEQTEAHDRKTLQLSLSFQRVWRLRVRENSVIWP